MRIQHNITAMNAYRNYNNNTSAINKNLEKLSSGYKINRAGDDAAGLAVSQKMRLQIAGLEQAQKNAKSGISMVQTAEGALTEVHDMLERMYTLAEQSANGTFDKETDRAQLQKELNSLRTEIDRIGKTANFNGIGLFAEYEGSGAAKVTAVDGSSTGITEQLGAYTIDVTLPADHEPNATSNDYIVFTVADTESNSTEITFEYQDDGTWTTSDSISGYNVTFNGTELKIEQATVSATTTSPFEGVTVTAVQIGGTAANGGTETPGDVDLQNDSWTNGREASEDATTTAASVELDFTGKTGKNVIGQTVTIDGTVYEFVKTGEAAKTEGATAISVAEDDQGEDIATAFQGAATVTDFTGEVTDSKVTYTETADPPTGSTTAPTVTLGTAGETSSTIWFAIGAEANDNNKLELGEMHLGSAGIYLNTDDAASGPVDISGVDISTQQGGWDALSAIKNATNAVSDMRGTLGATQNRLEHTINNLSVMEENIQDAESVIRDTDIAEEMMAYTKNNILIQSAQAMLAQANQLPQGVLQLLQ